MKRLLISINKKGHDVTFMLKGETIAKVWRSEIAHIWRYQVNPVGLNGSTDRSQDTAIEDVKHIITRELGRWGLTVLFIE